MPALKSAWKRLRQNQKRRERNIRIKSAARTAIKAVRKALTEGNTAQAKQLLQVAESRVGKAVAKGIYHKKTGARLVGRIASQVARAGS